MASSNSLDALASAEREVIVRALRRNKGNHTRPATDLGIHRSTSLRRMRRYGI